MNVKEHYDSHLGNFYSWMIGDYETLVSGNLSFFTSHSIGDGKGKTAVDFGCGNGVHSMALTHLGYSVVAFDFNKQLLNEFRSRIHRGNVIIVETDFMDFEKHLSVKPDLIICMGDTITHLNNLSDVELILQKSCNALNEKGRFIISFRDLTIPLAGVERFLPVKSDENRILTCFLEYFDNHVMVHDLLHEKDNGRWTQKISAYKKLRISGDEMKGMLTAAGFDVVSSEVINRMIYITAVKSQA